jgi:hypothetical protein
LYGRTAVRPNIIRNADELSRIREYIRNNPMAWEMDDEYPNHIQ